MQTTPAIDHEARPLACFNHLYRDLPRLFATGGTQAEVDALFGGLSPALQGALGVTPGASVGLRLFAEPWGWAPEAGPPVDVDRAALALDVAAPCFTFDFSMSDDYFRRLASWMAERGLVASAPPPETLWTNEIAF